MNLSEPSKKDDGGGGGGGDDDGKDNGRNGYPGKSGGAGDDGKDDKGNKDGKNGKAAKDEKSDAFQDIKLDDKGPSLDLNFGSTTAEIKSKLGSTWASSLWNWSSTK